MVKVEFQKNGEYTPYGELWVEEVSDSFDKIPFRFTGKEFDEETNLYYYGARYMNPRTSRWMSADPAMDGMNWYAYCSNNPINYVDPTGLNDVTDDIQRQIETYQAEYHELFMGQDYGSEEVGQQLQELESTLMDLYGQYNNAIIEEGNFDIEDYINNGVETGGFNEDQGLTGNYQTNAHTGVDGVGGYAKTPFYTILKNTDQGRSNSMTLGIIGTDLSILIAHGDKGSFLKTGGMYHPNQKIMPFPTMNNNAESSTGPHFHFQIANGVNFVNPYTMQASDTVFKFTNDGGGSWRKFITNF